MDLNVLTLRHPLTLAKLAFRKLGRMAASKNAPPPPGTETGAPLIDVNELIRSRSVEELNDLAEGYFSSLRNWDFHLAKPFGGIGDAPALLINFATMLQGLRLAPWLKVLDFGAGSGWTSRYLTQLGCEVFLLDVSPTALDIAKDAYRRQPPIGSPPEPHFLVYDGHRIDLPDQSVDRILSFDAFHHAPDPELVLREFARVLRPGGIAAFAEPGPNHSRTPQSQFEMRTYGVIEADIHIEKIWEMARAAGFARIELAAYNIPPFHVSLEKYDDLLSGGETFLRWAESTRGFLRDVRNFFLFREGEEALDSRQATDALRASIEVELPATAEAGAAVPVRATVTNTGRATWLPSGAGPGEVALGTHLYDRTGALRTFDLHWARLSEPPRPIEPGETVAIEFALPPLPAGSFEIEFDCVAEKVCWFAQVGSPTRKLPIEVR